MSNGELESVRIKYEGFEIERTSTRREPIDQLLEALDPILQLKAREAERELRDLEDFGT